MHFYRPQALLSLDSQCRDEISELKTRFGIGKSLCPSLVYLQAAWDGFDKGGQHPGGLAPPQDFPSWLPDFFEVILAATNSELRWCASVLPDLHPQLVLHLLLALFNKISKSFRSRLMSACAQGMGLADPGPAWLKP